MSDVGAARKSDRGYFREAQEAFAMGDYVRAASLYKEAMCACPELADLYQFNFRRALAKVNSECVPELQRDRYFLSNLYHEVELFTLKNSLDQERECDALVSVVMTTYNLGDYVEQSITSLLRQSYKNLEILVIDDSSSDLTWAILQRMKLDYPLVIRRLNTNLGTYFAKNFGVLLARGEYVFFQDGDDLSHPERIRLMMREFKSLRTVCVQGSYSRLAFPEGQVLPVNGMVKKPGLITMGVRKSVFEDIGFFNSTTKASDDEFFQRIRRYYHSCSEAIRVLDLPLYYTSFRENSLFSDMVANDPITEGFIAQKPSSVRMDYVMRFEDLHLSIEPGQFKNVFRFPLIRDVIPVESGMSRLANPKLPVVLSLCSIPERENSLKQTLASLSTQVDKIFIYLDRYEKIPDFIYSCHADVTVYTSDDFPGLRDNAKFLPLVKFAEECFFFTVDDDIIYPPDYVNSLIEKIEHYGRMAVVGVHGVLIPEFPTGYFSGFRRVYPFDRGLERDRLVNNLGTGTVAFHSGLLSSLNCLNFKSAGMVDLHLSAFCKKTGVPMIAVERPDTWLVEISDGSPSLFAEFVHSDDLQSKFVREHAPWGYTAIANAVDSTARYAIKQDSVEHMRVLLPALRYCIY